MVAKPGRAVPARAAREWAEQQRYRAQQQRHRAQVADVRGAELRSRSGRAIERAGHQVARGVDRWLATQGMEPGSDGRAADDVLDLILDRARTLYGGCGSASLTLVEQLGEEHPPYRSAPATGIAEFLDLAQYEFGEGPCVEAVELDMIAVVTAQDLSSPDERRDWPRFSRAAQDFGVRSALSIALPWTPLRAGLHPERWTVASINLYADRAHAFTQPERDGTLLGCWAGAVISGRQPVELFSASD
jgi:hypothetical protein